MTSIVSMPSHEVSEDLVNLVEDAARYAKASRAAGTLRAYGTDWKRFTEWCAAQGLQALPADPRAVALFITHLAKTHKPASINRSLAALRHFHKQAGQAFTTSDPLIAQVWGGVKRTKGTRQEGAEAILPEHLRQILRSLPDDLYGKRDRAIILSGFSGAFRRSEVVALTVENLTFVDRGIVVLVERSKTDQEGAGTEVAIPYAADQEMCPVRAVREWLKEAGISSGPVFRGIKDGRVNPTALCDKMVCIILQKRVSEAGLSGRFSAHSLRAGLVTAAALNGVSAVDIQRTTRHKSLDMVSRYVRVADTFKNNAAGAVL